jgi:hypothetical protein
MAIIHFVTLILWAAAVLPVLLFVLVVAYLFDVLGSILNAFDATA